VRIDPNLLSEVFEHATQDYPIEACGVLAGRGEPDRVIRMVNDADDERRYRFDPEEQLAVWQRLDQLRLDPLVIYHSHPHGRPWPSRTDIAQAQEGPLYLIVGNQDGHLAARLWRIEDGQVIEELIT
jgi:proteasome lid subunit RPN8/RPN11